MEAGLLVNNINNYVQIDSKFTNAVLRKSDNISVGVFGGYVDFNAELPLFFIRNESNSIFVSSKVVKTGDNSYRALLFNDGFTGTASVQYYIFDLVPPTLQESNFGLQVFDENGDPVFDSNAYYCNFVDFYIFPDFSIEKYELWVGGFGPREIFSYVVPEARSNKLAIMPAYAITGRQDSEFGYIIYCPTYRSSGMTIQMTCKQLGFEETGTPFSSYAVEKNNILVAEVGSLPVPYDINNN